MPDWDQHDHNLHITVSLHSYDFADTCANLYPDLAVMYHAAATNLMIAIKKFG